MITHDTANIPSIMYMVVNAVVVVVIAAENLQITVRDGAKLTIIGRVKMNESCYAMN